MIRYNCFVNVGGTDDKSKPTQVKKIGVSAAEILVLRSMFDPEAITDIHAGPNDKASHKDERALLDDRYGKHRTDPLFGAMVGGKLPMELDGEFPPIPDGDPLSPPALDYGAEKKPDFSVAAKDAALPAA